MSSDNPFGADNQQETRRVDLDSEWVVGFVDGEGCFSVSFHRNELARPTGGWHMQPTFHVSQHVDHVHVLEDLRAFFGCGRVHAKGAGTPVRVYSVYSTRLLEERILPFFEHHELRVKRDDFRAFAVIVRSIRKREHHRREVFDRLVRLAYGMNSRGKQRKRSMSEILLGSSETARQAPQDRR
jgi:hypothetical protein